MAWCTGFARLGGIVGPVAAGPIGGLAVAGLFTALAALALVGTLLPSA